MTAKAQIETIIITEDELLRLGADDKAFEVINGELVEMAPVGFRHVWLDFHVARLLHTFVESKQLGYILPDNLIYVLERDEQGGLRTTRVPDVSFIRRGRIPKDFDRSRPFPGAPDLAIEIVSPTEKPEDTLGKVRDYLRFGSEQVWVIYPEQGEIHQYHRDDTKIIHVYTGDDVIDTASLFPGLELKARALYELPPLE